MSIASAARRSIFPNPCLSEEHGALTGSTANLVSLLREAEEGKGLGFDYIDALAEALVEHNTEDGASKSKRRGGRPVYQVPLLTRTSCCRRKTRVLPGLPHVGTAAEIDEQRRRRVGPRDQRQQRHRSVDHLAVEVTRVADFKGLQPETRRVSLSTDSTGLELIDPAPDVIASDVHRVQPVYRHHRGHTSTLNTERKHNCGTHSRVASEAKQLASMTAPSGGGSMGSSDDVASLTPQYSAAIDRGFSLLYQGKPIVSTAGSPGQYASRAGTAPNASMLGESAVAAAVGAQFETKEPGKSFLAPETSFIAKESELTVGLGHWASEVVAMSQRLEDSRNQVSHDLEGVKRVEKCYRLRLEREAEHVMKSLPLSFLKEHGYLGEAQSRGLQKAWEALERQGVRVRARAWQTWKRFTEGCKWRDKNIHASRAAALCRGFLARRRVAEIRKELEEGSRMETKRLPLRRRLLNVSVASRVVASCVIANAADQRRRRACKLAAAVAMVETAFIRHRTRKQGWREIIQYQHEYVSAARIQRWTRGTLVRRRVPLVRETLPHMRYSLAVFTILDNTLIGYVDRRKSFYPLLLVAGLRFTVGQCHQPVQIMDRCCHVTSDCLHFLSIRQVVADHMTRMEQLDVMFKYREEVVQMHLVQHGAAVKIQIWWRCLPCRMRALRVRYKKALDKRAVICQRAYRRHLERRGFKHGGKNDVNWFGIKVPTPSAMAAEMHDRMEWLKATGGALFDKGQPVLMGLGRARQLVSALGYVAERTTLGTISPTNMRATLAAISPARVRGNRRKDHAAGRIQRSIRAKIARKRLLEKKREREIKAAETIQRLFRVRRQNKLVKRQRALFEGVCRQAIHRRTAKGKAAEIVTTVGRRWGQRTKYMRTRRWAISCQALVRGWIGRRRAESRRAYITRLGEERHAGAVRWEQLFRRREAEELLKGARSEDLEEDLELHKVFLKYCRFGDRRNNGRLQMAKLTALCKDAGITEAKKLPVQRVELGFSRLKPKDQSHMLYPGFLATLDDLALQNPDVQKAADAAAARDAAESVKVIARDAGTRRDSISSGGGGKLRPDNELLLVLLQKYVLVKSEAGKEACAELKADGRVAGQRAIGRLEAAAVVIQSSVARGCRDRAVAKEARERAERARKQAVLNWAVLMLQKRFRIHLAITRAAKLALKRYFKCLDGPTGAEYYFDPKTGTSSWTKPRVLGKFDIPTAIVMPTGDDTILVLMCRECAGVVATEICADCDDMFCDACATRLHRSAKTSTHLRVVIDICDECQFQVATKHCKQCQDNFCRTCFGHVHRRGRLKRHTFDPMAAMCHDCGDRPQAKRCFGCDGQGQLLLCRQCQNARHEGFTERDLTFHRCEDVGFVSLKVVRSKEKLAARAKLHWLKVQSAATGEKQRKRDREQATIKIQAVYRGHLARRRKAKLIEQYLLWRMQRLKDDQVRKKRSYKLLKTFGKAPQLKSDTNQELVLKQFPTWWQTTIVDIIRPGVGWHEAAKMVKEQDFFRKQAARRGRAEVTMAKMRVQLARRELRRAKRKEDQLMGLHAQAVAAYRHARVGGRVSAKHKEDLQQASRKAKRAIKLQQEERQKAECLLKNADGNLGALVGPFRLAKTVQRALKQGVLMPFPLSVQKGRAAARVPATHSMREVQKWMIRGRRVRMESVELSLSHPPPHALRPFVVRGVKDAPLPRAKPIKATVTDVAGAFSSVMATPAAALGEMRTENGELGGDRRGGGDVRGGALGDGDDQTPSTGSSPTLTFDRQWVLLAVVEARAFAMPVLPPLQGASIVLAGWVGGSRPVQLMVKAAAVAAHALSLRFERWQANFDEDSAMYARLVRWAAESQAHSVSLMLRRRYLFDIEKGFEIERRITDASEFLQTMWYRAQELKETVASAAATALVAKSAGGGKGGGTGTVLDRGAVLHLFNKWVRSDDRDKILVMHRSGSKANEAVELAGYVRVDLDTPTPVLREFIRRFCGGWLNDHAKGERFLMENSNGMVIRRSNEGGAGCATTMDMVQERLNKHTRATEAVVFVQDEIGRKDPEAEVPAFLVPAKDLLGPEAMPSFDGDHDGGDEQDTHPVGEIITKKISRRDGSGGDGNLSSESSDRPLVLEDEESSVGSLGSDVGTHEEDPFVGMEQDEKDRKKEASVEGDAAAAQ